MKTKINTWEVSQMNERDVYELNETEHEHDFYDGVCSSCGWDLREANPNDD